MISWSLAYLRFCKVSCIQYLCVRHCLKLSIGILFRKKAVVRHKYHHFRRLYISFFLYNYSYIITFPPTQARIAHELLKQKDSEHNVCMNEYVYVCLCVCHTYAYLYVYICIYIVECNLISFFFFLLAMLHCTVYLSSYSQSHTFDGSGFHPILSPLVVLFLYCSLILFKSSRLFGMN